MIFYLGLFALIFVLILVNQEKGAYVSFALLAIISIFRYETGNDWENYERFYENLEHYGFLKLELGYTLINFLFKWIGLEYYHVLAVTSVLTNLFYFKHIKRSGIFFISLLAFIRFTYFQTEFMFARQGLAIALLFTAIYYWHNREIKRALIYYVLGLLFHLSILIIIPFIPFLKKGRKVSEYIFLLLLAIILSLVDFTKIASFIPIDFIRMKAVGYVESDIWNKPSSFGFSIIERVILLILLIYSSSAKKILNSKFYLYFNTYFLGTILYIIFYKNYIFAERFSVIFNFSLIFLVPIVYANFNKNSRLLFLIYFSSTIIIYVLKILLSPNNTLLPYNNWLI